MARRRQCSTERPGLALELEMPLSPLIASFVSQCQDVRLQIAAFSVNVKRDSLVATRALQTGSGAVAKWLKQSVNLDLSFRKSFRGDVQLSRKQRERGPPLQSKNAMVRRWDLPKTVPNTSRATNGLPTKDHRVDGDGTH